MRGAARSRGGVPIIALPSTAAGGAASRIMPDLGRGGAVVTSRCAGLDGWVQGVLCCKSQRAVLHA